MHNKKLDKNMNWKQKLYIIIFEANTPAGKGFDVALLWAIILGILVVCLETLPEINPEYLNLLKGLEWFLTIIFTIEYIARIVVVERKWKYIFSFFGIIDFLSIIPTYLSVFIPGSQYALVIRVFRLMRIFRVLKLGRYLGESYVLLKALKASKYKITVFLEAVLTIVVIIGTLMYLIEGEAGGFDSIPHGIYWAIVTLTTVGYGDISPITPLGRAIASLVMLVGYGIIAVPTGIVTSELTRNSKAKNTNNNSRLCSDCQAVIEDESAVYCKYCGARLENSN